MTQTRKGLNSRKHIIEEANRLFNQKDRIHTIDEIASEMKVSKSKIANHFPKKEMLILGIYRHYQRDFKELIEQFNPDDENINFSELIKYYSKFMDLIYKYRFSISYIFVNPVNDQELSKHLYETIAANKKRIYQRLEYLVKSGLLDKEILKPQQFDVFIFQHTNLATTWVINHKIYDKNKGYKKVKPIYLRGVMNCFAPHLTETGRKDFNKVLNML